MTSNSYESNENSTQSADFEDLAIHCFKLGRWIAWFFKGQVDVSEWLDVAAGIVDLRFLSQRYEDAAAWCSTTAQFLDKRTEVLQPLIRELARFNFVWGAFESAVDGFSLPVLPDTNSDTTRVCALLKSSYEHRSLPTGYKDWLHELRVGLLRHPMYRPLADEFCLSAHIGISGVGLNVVRKLRNRFAHGTLSFPQHEDWGGDNSLDLSIVLSSARIVLTSLQMLFTVQFERLGKTAKGLYFEGDPITQLLTLQLPGSRHFEDQLQLSLD